MEQEGLLELETAAAHLANAAALFDSSLAVCSAASSAPPADPPPVAGVAVAAALGEGRPLALVDLPQALRALENRSMAASNL